MIFSTRSASINQSFNLCFQNQREIVITYFYNGWLVQKINFKWIYSTINLIAYAYLSAFLYSLLHLTVSVFHSKSTVCHLKRFVCIVYSILSPVLWWSLKWEKKIPYYKSACIFSIHCGTTMVFYVWYNLLSS